jgi:hypothetical protein
MKKFKELSNINEGRATESHDYHKSELKRTSDKIDNIVKSGGRVGLDDPLSVKLKKHSDAIKKMKMVKEEQLEEGRPSQRHPLEGHEYHKKTNAELEYIAKDAHKAAEAMKGHNTTAENKYRDQANDSATVRYFRQKSGTPDWYKKKYGHMKEETDTSEKTEMAQTQLHFMKYAAEEILEYIEMGGEVEEWYQNKLSKVMSDIESLHSYVEGESRRTGMKEEVSKTVPTMSNAPKMVRDRKTGQMYDPNKKFKELMNKPEIKAVMNRLAKEEVVDENYDDRMKKELDRAKTATPKKPADEYERKVVKYLKKKHDMKEEVDQVDEAMRPGFDYAKAAKTREQMKAKGLEPGDRPYTWKKTGVPSPTPADTEKKMKEGTVNEVMDEPKYSLSIQARQKKADDANKPPFGGPYKKTTGVVTDKSGAKHTPMSRVRDLARKAAQQQSKLKESDLTEADAKDYHTVHVNGRHWKTFETKSHAENVAKKIKGATVQKYDAERLQQNYGAKSAARNAARGKQYDESVEVDQLQEGRRANIVREAMEAAKKKKKQQQEQSSDKFNADPTLSSEIVKT